MMELRDDRTEIRFCFYSKLCAGLVNSIFGFVRSCTTRFQPVFCLEPVACALVWLVFVFVDDEGIFLRNTKDAMRVVNAGKQGRTFTTPRSLVGLHFTVC